MLPVIIVISGRSCGTGHHCLRIVESEKLPGTYTCWIGAPTFAICALCRGFPCMQCCVESDTYVSAASIVSPCACIINLLVSRLTKIRRLTERSSGMNGERTDFLPGFPPWLNHTSCESPFACETWKGVHGMSELDRLPLHQPFASISVHRQTCCLSSKCGVKRQEFSAGVNILLSQGLLMGMRSFWWVLCWWASHSDCKVLVCSCRMCLRS